MNKSSIEIVKTIATALENILDNFVFVGGSVVALYIDDKAAPEVRVTEDVDCVNKSTSYCDHTKMEEKLRSFGFVNSSAEDAPICRWEYKEIKIDIMPSNPNVLGFGNPWYIEGLKNTFKYNMGNGININMFSPPIFICTKIEAHRNRGQNDCRTSSDIEDVIFVLNGRSTILDEIKNSEYKIRKYLRTNFIEFMNKGLSEAVESSLREDHLRVPYVLGLIEKIVELS